MSQDCSVERTPRSGEHLSAPGQANGGTSMNLKFYLLKERMFKEVEDCITQGRLETLLSFCNCCLYKMFEDSPLSECQECRVQQGIAQLSEYGKSKEEKPLARCFFSPRV
jgi:hypothetical protein